MRARIPRGPGGAELTSGGPGAVLVRLARRDEWEERARLLRPAGLGRAFVHLLLQEVTLQALLLGGAVLFIFCGVGAAQCALLAPLAVAVLLLGARHELAAARERTLQSMSEEELGLVALAGASLVGTASLRGSRLSALGVAGAWRRRGVGRALAEAAAGRALDQGQALLEAHVDEMQTEARAMLQRMGWQCLGAYQRPLCLGAVSLAVARLALELTPTDALQPSDR